MTWFNGRRIIVPFDFSQESVRAVEMALQLAERPDEVHVAHVLLQLPATDPAVIWDEQCDEKRKKTVRASLEKQLSDHNLTGVQINVSIGSPGPNIADLAEEIEAGLVIIPSHGYTGLKRWFLGSVAERVVHLAQCPVLVLKHRS